MQDSKGIKSWSTDDRPREKLALKGASVLSDAELLAIILGSGSRNETAVELSRRILNSVKNDLSALARLEMADLKKFKGMGEAKSVSVLAVMELARRRRSQEVKQKSKLTSSHDVFEYFLQNMGDLKHEEFWVMYLSKANKVLAVKKVGEGGVSSTVADPKRVFDGALENKASSVIVAHNHPSGNLSPSKQDQKLTSQLRKAGVILECPLLDHLIITDSGYFSFADEGILDAE